MKAKAVYARLWDALLMALQEEVSKRSANQVAKDLGVTASTVTRWLAKERGTQKVSLENAILIAEKLRFPVDKLVKLIAPEGAAAIILLLSSDPRLVRDLAELHASDPEATKRVADDIRFHLARPVNPPSQIK